MTDSQLVADVSSVSEMAERYRLQLKAQFCIVTDAHGAWMGTPGWPAGTPAPPVLRGIIDAAVAGRSQREIVAVGDRLFLLIAEPARFGEEVLGTLSVGYALDDAMAEQFALATHCDVNLVVGTHLCGSSLRGADRQELQRWLSDPRREPSRFAVPAGLWHVGAATVRGGGVSAVRRPESGQPESAHSAADMGTHAAVPRRAEDAVSRRRCGDLRVRAPRRIRVQQKHEPAAASDGGGGARHRVWKLGACRCRYGEARKRRPWPWRSTT